MHEMLTLADRCVLRDLDDSDSREKHLLSLVVGTSYLFWLARACCENDTQSSLSRSEVSLLVISSVYSSVTEKREKHVFSLVVGTSYSLWLV
jgi:hypothetical protein